MLFRLVILNGPMSGHRLTVTETVMTVGRAEECGLALPDDEVALEHLEIRLKDGALHFRDLGSMGGTLVNQVELRHGRLKHGDVIEVGRTRLLIEAHVEAEVPARCAGELPVSSWRRRFLWAAVALLVGFGLWGWTVRMDSPVERGVSPEALPYVARSPAPEEDMPHAIPSLAAPAPEPEVADLVDRFADDRPVTDEIRRLRGDIEALRETMASLAEEWISSVSAETRTTEGSDAITAQALLLRARAEVEQGRMAEADRLLAGLQVLAPTFTEAWAERARLLEQRGRLSEAESEWKLVRERVDDPEWVRRAGKELERIGQLRWEQEAASATVSISGLSHRKFPVREGIAEMRTLTVRLVPDEPHMRPNPSDVTVEVAFFDRDQPDGNIMPSPRVPPAVLRPEGEWAAGEPLDLVATYRVDSSYPDGWLLTRREDGITYFGCRVRLFVRGELVSEVFRPMILADISVATEAASIQPDR